MITFHTSQFNSLLSKELKEAFRDKRAMLSDVSAMMDGLNINTVEGIQV